MPEARREPNGLYAVTCECGHSVKMAPGDKDKHKCVEQVPDRDREITVVFALSDEGHFTMTVGE